VVVLSSERWSCREWYQAPYYYTNVRLQDHMVRNKYDEWIF
jgi:hypothetical protein